MENFFRLTSTLCYSLCQDRECSAEVKGLQLQNKLRANSHVGKGGGIWFSETTIMLNVSMQFDAWKVGTMPLILLPLHSTHHSTAESMSRLVEACGCFLSVLNSHMSHEEVEGERTPEYVEHRLLCTYNFMTCLLKAMCCSNNYCKGLF